MGPDVPPCTICLSPLESDLVALSTCGHVFHNNCIREWNAQKKDHKKPCPYCRTQQRSTSIVPLIYKVNHESVVDVVLDVDENDGEEVKELKIRLRRSLQQIDVLKEGCLLRNKENIALHTERQALRENLITLAEESRRYKEDIEKAKRDVEEYETNANVARSELATAQEILMSFKRTIKDFKRTEFLFKADDLTNDEVLAILGKIKSRSPNQLLVDQHQMINSLRRDNRKLLDINKVLNREKEELNRKLQRRSERSEAPYESELRTASVTRGRDDVADVPSRWNRAGTIEPHTLYTYGGDPGNVFVSRTKDSSNDVDADISEDDVKYSLQSINATRQRNQSVRRNIYRGNEMSSGQIFHSEKNDEEIVPCRPPNNVLERIGGNVVGTGDQTDSREQHASLLFGNPNSLHRNIQPMFTLKQSKFDGPSVSTAVASSEGSVSVTLDSAHIASSHVSPEVDTIKVKNTNLYKFVEASNEVADWDSGDTLTTQTLPRRAYGKYPASDRSDDVSEVENSRRNESVGVSSPRMQRRCHDTETRVQGDQYTLIDKNSKLHEFDNSSYVQMRSKTNSTSRLSTPFPLHGQTRQISPHLNTSLRPFGAGSINRATLTTKGPPRKRPAVRSGSILKYFKSQT